MDVTEKEGTQSPVMLPALTEQLKQGDLVPLGKFDDDKRRRIAQIDASVTLRDTNSIEAFAVSPQRKASAFLDQLLTGIKTDSVGESGAMVAELAGAMKRVDLQGMRKNAENGGKSGLASIPLVGKPIAKLFDTAKRYQAMQADIVKHIEAIEARATTQMGKLKSGTANMDRLLDITEVDLRELELWLAGGQQALLRMRAEYHAASTQALQSGDEIQLSKVRDMAEQINAFETRLVRLSLSFTNGLLSIPEIRSAQVAGRIEFQNTMDTVLSDIPDIKKAIIRIANLRQITKANEATDARREMRRTLEVFASDLGSTTYLKAKESQGNFTADITALGSRVERMLTTLERGAQIDVENHAKRGEAIQRIGEVRERLLSGMKAHNESSVQA
jgi:uncharacterized protein YaaN involved in tellurite resistance